MIKLSRAGRHLWMRQLAWAGMGIGAQRAVGRRADPGRMSGVCDLGGDARFAIGLDLETGEILRGIGNGEVLEESLAEGRQLERGQRRNIVQRCKAERDGCGLRHW